VKRDLARHHIASLLEIARRCVHNVDVRQLAPCVSSRTKQGTI
jgi:hypothetical protein